jgi:hypothetical protein
VVARCSGDEAGRRMIAPTVNVRSFSVNWALFYIPIERIVQMAV